MFTMDHNIWWRTLGLSTSVSTPHDVLIQVFSIPDNLVLHETLYTNQEQMVVAALVGASETSVVTGLTELVRRLGKGEGVSSTVPVAFSRTMKAHDMEEALRVVRTEVALEAKVAFVKGTDVLSVSKDPTGESDISKEASRALVRALAASCLGEDLRRMVESHNRDRTANEALTFDEFTQWLHAEVGGKFPLTSYLKGLGALLVGRVWSSDTYSMRLADLKLQGRKVANTIALYADGHKPYLIAKWKAWFGEGPRSGDGGSSGASELEAKGEEELDTEIEDEVASWKKAAMLRLEPWARPDGMGIAIAKAQQEARERWTE